MSQAPASCPLPFHVDVLIFLMDLFMQPVHLAPGWLLSMEPHSTGHASNSVKGLHCPWWGRDGRPRQEEWAEGTAEARPRLSNSGAKNRLVSLTTETESAHLLPGRGVLCACGKHRDLGMRKVILSLSEQQPISENSPTLLCY